MSLILEALKKSEQQRRLGEAPNLGTPIIVSRRRRSGLPLLAALIAIALGVGWWLLRTPARAPVDRHADTATPAAAPPHVAAPTPHAPVARNPLARREPVARAPAAPAQRARPAPATALPATPLAGNRPGSVANLPPSALVGAPHAARTNAAPNAPATATAPHTRAMDTQPAAAAPKPAPPPHVPGVARPATAPAAVARRSSAPALPSIWELPYSTRKDIPALAMTLHVYADAPQDRFVVIDGERHVEGDDLGDGLILREIRADGIVLDLKGKRFVYPRDGR